MEHRLLLDGLEAVSEILRYGGLSGIAREEAFLDWALKKVVGLTDLQDSGGATSARACLDRPGNTPYRPKAPCSPVWGRAGRARKSFRFLQNTP